MTSNKDIYQHYHPSDREFIDKGLDWINRVWDSNVLYLTPFLNPHEGMILTHLAQGRGLEVYASSDNYPSEQARYIIAPDYYVLDLADFEMELLELDYAHKFHSLKHSQILGSLLHQLGIKRSTFGDILVDNKRFQIMVDQRFSLIFQDQLTKVGRVSVQLRQVPFDQIIQAQKDAKTKDLLLSSMRLDKCLAASFHLSRSKALELIQAGLVKVNYNPETNPSRNLSLGDQISVRRFGRIFLKESHGLSKNGKHKISVEIVHSK